MSLPKPRRSARVLQCRGLTLIELLVALVIGLIVALGAASATGMFEGVRRGLTGESGAIENGIAVGFDLQREVQGAGLWSVGAPCQRIWKYDPDSKQWESSTDLTSTSWLGAPVELAAAASDTDSDSLTVRSMSGMLGAPVTLTKKATGASFEVSSTAGFKKGDTILITPPAGSSGECFLAVVTAVQDAAAHIQARPSVNGAPANALPSAYDYPAHSQVFNMGQSRVAHYRVSRETPAGKDLSVFETVDLGVDADGDPDRNGSTTVLAENIVLLRAQYGISANAASLAVERWVNPGNAEARPERLRALRFVVVARSAQPDLKNRDDAGRCITTRFEPEIPWHVELGRDDVPRPLEIGLADERAPCHAYRILAVTAPLKNYIFSGGGA